MPEPLAAAAPAAHGAAADGVAPTPPPVVLPAWRVAPRDASSGPGRGAAASAVLHLAAAIACMLLVPRVEELPPPAEETPVVVEMVTDAPRTEPAIAEAPPTAPEEATAVLPADPAQMASAEPQVPPDGPPPEATDAPPAPVEVAEAPPPPPPEPPPPAREAARPAEPTPPPQDLAALEPPPAPPRPVPPPPPGPQPRAPAAPAPRPPSQPRAARSAPSAPRAGDAPPAGPPRPAPPAPAPAVPAAAAPSPNYVARLLAALEREKRYPEEARWRRAQGVALLRFRLRRDGSVAHFRIERSAGDPALDEAVLAMVRRASPLPAPPPDLPGEAIELSVPVRFALR